MLEQVLSLALQGCLLGELQLMSALECLTLRDLLVALHE